MYLGDYTEDATNLNFSFTTRNTSGVPTVLAGTPVIAVYKANETGTEKTSAETYITLAVDFDSIVGLNHVLIDLNGDVFFAVGADYKVVITTGTVGGGSVVGEVVGSFSIENRFDEVDVTKWLGTAPLALLSQRVRTAVGAMDANVVTAAAIATAAIDADALATDAITAAKIAAGAIGVSEAPNLDAAVSTRATPAQVGSELDSRNLDHLVGTATGIPALPAGTYLDQGRRTVAGTFDRDTDSQEAIRDRGDAAWTTGAGVTDWTSGERENIRDALGVDGTKTAASGGDVQNIQGRLPTSLVAGRMDASVGAMAAAVLTAAAIATDAFDADALAADAITEIWAKIVETQGSRTAQQVMSILLSTLAGVTDTSGAVFKTSDGVATRVTATVNASNERTAITLAPSA